MRICFASHNANKVNELNQIVPDNITIVGLDELGLEEDIAETGKTLEENSMIKAEYVFKKLMMPVIADDSGLIVSALGGEPGVRSARYAGPDRNDQENMQLLQANLKPKNDRSAEFQTVITYIDQNGQSKQWKGSISGTIIKEKRGSNGFGYDPIFQPDGYDETFAELPSETKNRISHRAKAVQQLLEYLKNSQ